MIGGGLIFVFVLLLPALGIWVAIDAGTKPPWAFERAGQNKTLWIVLPIVGLFVCGVVTIVAAIVWFASIKPKVMSAATAGLPQGGGFSVGALPATPAASQPGASTPHSPVSAQWSADPFGRYELRYWNGSEWTEHVSRGGVTAVDPPE